MFSLLFFTTDNILLAEAAVSMAEYSKEQRVVELIEEQVRERLDGDEVCKRVALRSSGRQERPGRKREQQQQ